MKVGDLVKIVQSPVDDLVPSHLGEIGMIVETFNKFSNIYLRGYDKWYKVSLHGGFMKFRIDYLEVVSESR